MVMKFTTEKHDIQLQHLSAPSASTPAKCCKAYITGAAVEHVTLHPANFKSARQDKDAS
jgi:hypothetical protein